MLLKIAARLQMLKQDRGEGPIPHIIMIAIISAGALVIAGVIVAIANDWVDEIARP